MMSIDPSLHGYTPQHTAQFLSQLRDRAAAIPGVSAAAITDVPPLSDGNRSDTFSVVGRKSTTPDPNVEMYMATSDYFQTLGIPRLSGRDFGNENPTGPKVAIVSQSLAATLFGNENPIGRQITGAGQTYEIIGVAGNIKSRTLGEAQRPVLYRSLDQSITGDPSFMGYSLIVHTAGDSASVAAALRRQIHQMDPTLAIFNAATVEEHLHDALFLPRLAGTLFGIFGLAGLLLAAVGLYGVISYSVSRRTHEIGIRMALGAQLGSVQRMVVGQGLRLTAIALALGLPVAFALARFSASVLYGVAPHDLPTFTAVPAFLVLVALLACWLPSRRASRINPVQALRYNG